MTEIECAGKIISIDKDGFLTSLEDWNEEVAQVLAKREGLSNFDDHQMEIIKFMQEYYRKFKHTQSLITSAKTFIRKENISAKNLSTR